MSYIDAIKRCISIILPVKVNRGYGVSTDDMILMSAPLTIEQIEEPLIKTGALYRTKSEIGRFEMVGFVKGSAGQTNYQLRHILSGELFNVSKKMMILLFEKDCAT